MECWKKVSLSVHSILAFLYLVYLLHKNHSNNNAKIPEINYDLSKKNPIVKFWTVAMKHNTQFTHTIARLIKVLWTKKPGDIYHLNRLSATCIVEIFISWLSVPAWYSVQNGLLNLAIFCLLKRQQYSLLAKKLKRFNIQKSLIQYMQPSIHVHPTIKL